MGTWGAVDSQPDPIFDYYYYYKSAGGAEIDVIIEGPEETLAIEIKHTKHPSSRDSSSASFVLARSAGASCSTRARSEGSSKILRFFPFHTSIGPCKRIGAMPRDLWHAANSP
ncbi:MAG: hypothetical protein KAI47_00415 [Deltaproteobacteria bacterium]|nr:hypothetical protein [Deltaproteobacteria bacterium]